MIYNFNEFGVWKVLAIPKPKCLMWSFLKIQIKETACYLVGFDQWQVSAARSSL